MLWIILSDGELEGKPGPGGGGLKYIFADVFSFSLGESDQLFQAGFELP